MKKAILSLIAFASLATGLQAATISIGAGFGATQGIQVKTTTGELIAGGYYIGVGTFDAVPSISDLASLKAALGNFKAFGSATSPTSGTTLGKIAASITAVPADPSIFNTKEIYIVIGNADTLDKSEQYAILRGTPTTWAFPGDTAAGGATTISLANVGNFDPITNAGTEADGAIDSITLAGIPEPSASMLALLGALGLMRRKR